MSTSVRNVSLVLLAALLTLAFTAPAIAANLTVEWDGNTTDNDLAGYRVYMASSAAVFQLTPAAARAQATTRDVTGTSTVFSGLAAGTTYWFGVTAYDTSGNESGFSNIASGVPADTSAPVVSISSPSGGATVSGSVVISATASDDVAVAGVRFRVDGADLSPEDTSNPWSISWNTTGVADGAHTLTAVARDAAGNATTSSSVSVAVQNADTTPPSVSIAAPSGGATVTGTVSITASASDDEGVAGVQFRLDGTNIGSEDTTAPYSVAWDTRTATGGAHALTAVARDTSGNTQVSAGVSVTVSNPDTTDPSVSISQPSAGATVTGTGVMLRATATDNTAVVGVQFRVDGANVGAEDLSSPWETPWNSTTVSDGQHSVTAVARDAAGNSTTSAAVTIAVDNPDTTGPTVSITAPAGGAILSGTVSVTATAADSDGVAGVTFLLDGTAIGSEDTSSPYSRSWNTNNTAEGQHVLTAVARDASGNTTTSAPVTVTVDNADDTLPTVSITAPANNATVSGTVALTASATDNVGVVGVRFRVNGADVGSEDVTAPYTASWNTSSLANGTYTITAVARDAAGNTKTSATITVTVNNADTTPPAPPGNLRVRP